MTNRNAAHAALDELRGTAYSDEEKILRGAAHVRNSGHHVSEEEAIKLVRDALAERDRLSPGYDTTIEV